MLGLVAHSFGCAPATDPSVVDGPSARDAPPPIIARIDAAPYDARDAPVPDGDAYDPRLCISFVPGTFGSACRADRTCDSGLQCSPGVSVRVRTLEGTTVEVPVAGDFCTQRCNPNGVRPCACGVCTTSLPFGSSRVSVADELGRGLCVQPCVAGACLGAFGCDERMGVCTPACTGDDGCLYTSRPGESDVRFTEVERGPPIAISCSRARGACVRAGPERFRGDPCDTDFDCALGNVCFAPDPSTPGRCATLDDDCLVTGCGPTDACIALDATVAVCARR